MRAWTSVLALLLCSQLLAAVATLPEVPSVLTQAPDGSLAAATPISTEQPAMTIPTKLVLWAPGALALPKIGEALRAAALDQLSCVALALCYIWSDPEAELHSWAQSLPLEFNTPLHWSEEERLELQGGMAAGLIAERKQWIDTTYTQLDATLLQNRELFPSEHFTKQIFTRALSVVWQRGAALEVDGGKAVALIPHLDPAKRTPLSSTQLVVRDGAVHVLATLDAGAILQVSGGSSMEMFLNRGEVLETGEHTRVLLRGHPDPDQLLGAPKLKMLQQAGLQKDRLYWVGMHGVDPSLISALRIDALTPTDLGSYRKGQAGQMMSVGNELAAYRLLIQICTETLNMYGSSLEEDTTLLQKDVVGATRRAALLHRRNEKFVLQRCTGVARKRWQQLLWRDL